VLRSIQDGGAAALLMGAFIAMECSIEFCLCDLWPNIWCIDKQRIKQNKIPITIKL